MDFSSAFLLYMLHIPSLYQTNINTEILLIQKHYKMDGANCIIWRGGEEITEPCSENEIEGPQ